MEPEALYLRLLGLSRLGLSQNLGNSLKSNASSILIIISLAISWPYIRPYHMFLDSVITIKSIVSENITIKIHYMPTLL
jgi:hypothetical protein